MFRALEIIVGVNVEVLGCKFISIGTNGSNVFQGSRIGFKTQLDGSIRGFASSYVYTFLSLT
jgi:hypothetical protein